MTLSKLADLFRRKPVAREVANTLSQPKMQALNPMDPLSAMGAIVEDDDGQLSVPNSFREAPMLDIGDFPHIATREAFVGDAALPKSKYVADSLTGQGTPDVKNAWSAYEVPAALQAWYNSQSFIGYQACALMAQNWLVDKVCTMPGEDAVRNGYEITIADEDDEAFTSLGMEQADVVKQIKEADEKTHGIAEQLIQFWRFKEIYGIRVCVFDVKSDDPDYYSKPFNIDGVTKGSYRGIKQIDPYWMMPVLAGAETVDPTDRHFYEPSYWVIGGKKYHRSHLIIGRASVPADILKPTYIFGGIPLTQRIYERIYASERTANEGPLLAMTKRTTVLHTDLAKMEAQPQKFMSRLLKWVGLRDNYGVKAVGIGDVVEQFDTSLADLDAVIMTQYQLVAAIGQVPATKLLGTSPKGFNATGEFEMKSYHERLESVHTFMDPLLARHHELLVKSIFGVEIPIKAVWNRVDSYTALELANLNALKVDAGVKLLDAGVISPDEERNRIKGDDLSGYNHLDDADASDVMGATPENEAKLQTATAKTDAAQAQGTAAGAKVTMAEGHEQGESDAIQPHLDSLRAALGGQEGTVDGVGLKSRLEALQSALAGTPNAPEDLRAAIHTLASAMGMKAAMGTVGDTIRGTPPGTKGVTRRQFADHGKTFVTGDTSSAGLIAEGGAQYTQRVMPRVRLGRLSVAIENPVDSIRAGTASDGTEWRTQMKYAYGYIVGTLGADGDEVDAFIGPNLGSRVAYVVNQVDPVTRGFDEHKIMLGFDSEDEALQAYSDSFQKGWDGFDSIVTMPWDDFLRWVRDEDMTGKPA